MGFPQHPRSDLLLNRRTLLRSAGGLLAYGFGLRDLGDTRAGEAGPALDRKAVPSQKARSCIFIYLLGGPPHQDMWDLKPDAPAEIRGPFKPIATNVTGIQICEHLPRLAQLAPQYSLVRSVTRRNSNHTPMIYYTLTGREVENPALDNDVRPHQRTDFPHIGAVLARFAESNPDLPGYVAMPENAVRTSGAFQRGWIPLRGGGSGFLGPRYEPLTVNGDPGTPDAIPAVKLPTAVSRERWNARQELLSLLDAGDTRLPALREQQTLRDKAIVLTGAANRDRTQPFSLDGESDRLLDRYGRHRFGRALVTARRLTETGVPAVAIHFNNMSRCDGWDTHSKNFEALKGELLPMVDQGLSALLEDLDARGRLEETLVVCMGEFGRTPKINANAGRDHWGECASVFMAGGGIQGGQVIGASDKQAAYPTTDPVDPSDIHATIFRCFGLDPTLTMVDQLQRPWPLSAGKVIEKLL